MLIVLQEDHNLRFPPKDLLICKFGHCRKLLLQYSLLHYYITAVFELCFSETNIIMPFSTRNVLFSFQHVQPPRHICPRFSFSQQHFFLTTSLLHNTWLTS